jgi:probable rRNA maturation factor
VSEPPSPTRPTVEVSNETDQPLDTDRWAHLAETVLADQGITTGELTLTFVDESTIADLNATHMGADGPTDVLSFPLDVDDARTGDPDLSPVPGQPILIGDVVICPAVAAANAPQRLDEEPHPGHPSHDGTIDDELALLVVHGVLHICGHDHAEPDEAAAMWAAERAVLATALDRDGAA